MISDFLSPIANHLWQSTVFAGAAGLLTLTLRKNSARVRHWVWVTASVKFLVPFAVLIGLGSEVRIRTATEPTEANFAIALDQVSQPFTIPVSSTPLSNAVPARIDFLPAIVLLAWACGFIGKASSWSIHWRRMRAIVRAGSPIQLGLPIRTISSPSFMEPGVFGVLRPVLLVPEGFFDHLEPDQWKSVLGHELCHIRHRDNLIATIHFFIESVFWFYPVVWWIGKRIFQERERACDEEVVRLGNQPRAYAQGILKICELYLESPMECVAGVSGSNLRRRIERIMNDSLAIRVNLVKKTAMICAGIVCLALPVVVGVWGPAVHAQSASQQSVAGTWQGTLQAGSGSLRIVIKISKDTGGWKALMYRIDQGPVGTPGSAVATQDSNIKITFPAIGGTFEGTLSGDGNSLGGTWAGLRTIPLSLVRATADTAWAIPEPTAPPTRMAEDANPAFEVATVKLSRPDDQRSPTIQIQYRRLLTWNKSVMNLITFAYSINPREVVNGPDWLNMKYDIVAQPGGEGQPSLHQWQIMLQKLLAERFRLSYHREKREVSIYALTVAKNGPKLLAPNTGDPKGLPNLALPARGRFRARNATMLDFAGELQGWQERPVVDRTGIQGRYDFGLNWTPDDYQASLLSGSPAPRDSNEAPDLFTALQEQLGLTLESTEGSVDVLVIDHVERPTEN